MYDLVWSEPLSSLCARFGISDVALRKTCQRAMVPTPERGYWARKEAGKKAFVRPFSERPPAMDHEVQVGGWREYSSYHIWTDDELLDPLQPPPQFGSTLESVRDRITKAIGKVTVRREVTDWHPAISRLLKENAVRREKQRASGYVLSSERTQFDSLFVQRRLRILNSLFIAVEKFCGRPLRMRSRLRYRSTVRLFGSSLRLRELGAEPIRKAAQGRMRS